MGYFNRESIDGSLLWRPDGTYARVFPKRALSQIKAPAYDVAEPAGGHRVFINSQTNELCIVYFKDEGVRKGYPTPTGLWKEIQLEKINPRIMVKFNDTSKSVIPICWIVPALNGNIPTDQSKFEELEPNFDFGLLESKYPPIDLDNAEEADRFANIKFLNEYFVYNRNNIAYHGRSSIEEGYMPILNQRADTTSSSNADSMTRRDIDGGPKTFKEFMGIYKNSD